MATKLAKIALHDPTSPSISALPSNRSPSPNITKMFIGGVCLAPEVGIKGPIPPIGVIGVTPPPRGMTSYKEA